MPGPGGGDDGVEVGYACLPAEHGVRAACICDQDWRIASAARRLAFRNAESGDALGAGDGFAHRMTDAGSEIERNAAAAAFEILQCANMRLSQILDVDVIAHGAAVG